MLLSCCHITGLTCRHSGVSGVIEVTCMSNNPLELQNSTVESTGVLLPCECLIVIMICLTVIFTYVVGSNSDTSITFSLTLVAYPPGLYNITVNVIDVYGQTASTGLKLSLTGRLLLMLAILSKLQQITCSHSTNNSTTDIRQMSS